jgi:sugar fermentation stimulation protein A
VISKDLVSSYFYRRVNRFVIECTINDRLVQAYLPNPGRLWELLQEGSEVLLVKKKNPLKFQYHAISVKSNNSMVLLDTHYNNNVARTLIENKKIDVLKDYTIQRQEFSVKKSRFDFLLERGEEKLILEVKSCTLFFNNLAMFPDAPSTRAKRHVEELAELATNGIKTALLFIVYSSDINYFLPEFNVDVEFAESLYKNRNNIIVEAIGIKNFMVSKKEIEVRKLYIPWEVLKNKLINSGNYLLIIFLNENKSINIGHLGYIYFEVGYYIYVGSSMRNLKQRINRHKDKIKKLFWHIDYLLQDAKLLHVLPIRSETNLECSVAREIKNIANKTISYFGSSDCNCASHLYKFDRSPVNNSKFINILLRYRMGLLIDSIS